MSDPLLGTAYRALSRLGRGGMGEVWDAEHVELGKRVVVKLLHANLSNGASFVERFRVEARVLAQLSHPNVVGVSDFGWVGGRPYLVMEKVEGRSLADEVKSRRDPLPLAEVLPIARQLLAGLGAAHAAGVIHRDVKPANVLYGPPCNGARRVTLVDFGLVKQLNRSTEALTAVGSVMGTPSYFAPEQALGRPTDARTDLYSAGALFYRLLTGHTPFERATMREMALAHVRDLPPPPSSFVPDLPPLVDAVLLKALAKNPDRRFASAEEMAFALAACEAPAGSAAPAVSETTRPAPDVAHQVATPAPAPLPALATKWRRVRTLPSLVDTTSSSVPAVATPTSLRLTLPSPTMQAHAQIPWLVAALVAMVTVALAWIARWMGGF